MFVLLLMPALCNQTDKVENTNKIGRPDENPRNNSFRTFFKKYWYLFIFQLGSPKRGRNKTNIANNSNLFDIFNA